MVVGIANDVSGFHAYPELDCTRAAAAAAIVASSSLGLYNRVPTARVGASAFFTPYLGAEFLLSARQLSAQRSTGSYPTEQSSTASPSG